MNKFSKLVMILTLVSSINAHAFQNAEIEQMIDSVENQVGDEPLAQVEAMAEAQAQAQAQGADEGTNPGEGTSDTKLTIDPSKYSLLQYSDILIKGQKYHKLTYAPKYESLEPGTISGMLVFGNFFADAMVGLSVMAWEPNWATWPSNYPKPDKVKHFMAGYVIANVSNGVFQILLPENTRFRVLKASLLGFATATAVGIAKEVYDDKCNCGTPEVKDAVATALGGALGTLTLSFDIRKPFTRSFSAPF